MTLIIHVLNIKVGGFLLLELFPRLQRILVGVQIKPEVLLGTELGIMFYLIVSIPMLRQLKNRSLLKIVMDKYAHNKMIDGESPMATLHLFKSAPALPSSSR